MAYSAISNDSFFQRKWLTDEGIHKLLKHRYSFDKVFDFDKGLLNHAIGSHFKEIEGGIQLNSSGHFRIKRRLTIEDEDGKDISKSVYFYYKTDEGKSCGLRPGNRDKEGWKKLYGEAQNIVSSKMTINLFLLQLFHFLLESVDLIHKA
jgi:hypothetical protein